MASLAPVVAIMLLSFIPAPARGQQLRQQAQSWSREPMIASFCFRVVICQPNAPWTPSRQGNVVIPSEFDLELANLGAEPADRRTARASGMPNRPLQENLGNRLLVRGAGELQRDTPEAIDVDQGPRSRAPSDNRRETRARAGITGGIEKMHFRNVPSSFPRRSGVGKLSTSPLIGRFAHRLVLNA